MKKLFAAAAALALLATAGMASAQVTAGSAASSQVASGAGAVTLGPGAAIGVTGATNTSAASASALRIPFVFSTTAANTNTTGSTVNTHAQSGLSLGGSTAQQGGTANAFSFARWPF